MTTVEVTYNAELDMPIADIRALWDKMVEDAKANPGVKHTLFLPQGARLESPLLHTSFSNPGGGLASVTVKPNGRWDISCRKTQIGGFE